MARAATTTTGKRSYTVELVGPSITGTYSGRVCCDGQTIGWTAEKGTANGIQREAGVIVERHQAGTVTLDVDPAALRAEAEAEARPQRRAPVGCDRPMRQADVNEYERARQEHNAEIRADNEVKAAAALKRIAREQREARERGRVAA